ncbi:hypothetical protein [Planktotalea arctica]|uniref:hypothetical protein n=1 Tax=Planktotalea arctica TaxID=1481893 RepID=UPI00321BE249
MNIQPIELRSSSMPGRPSFKCSQALNSNMISGDRAGVANGSGAFRRESYPVQAFERFVRPQRIEKGSLSIIFEDGGHDVRP